ncbi:MAG: Fur family transcriptional regulator [Cyanobacteriota bacterium]
MVNNTDEIIKSLRKKGYRITPQREQLLQFFFDLPEGTHLSAEELQLKLGEKNIKISLATLYRSLKLLTSVGLLRELDFAEDHKHYELFRGASSYHHHIICVNCSNTIEIQDKTLYELGEKLSKEYEIELIDVQFKLFGVCKNCQNKRL